MDKKVSFSAVDNGVSSAIDRLRAKAQELSRDMIQDAQKYSQSGKEQLRYIEDQIKAIERRNKIDVEGRKLSSTTKEERSGIVRESHQEDLFVKLLRELIETTKFTAKEEIREGKKNVERQITEETKAKVMPGGEEGLKRAVQRDLLEGEKKDKSTFKEVFKGVLAGELVSNVVRGAINMGSGIATATDENQALSRILGGIPGVGGIAEATYGKHLTESLKAEQRSKRLAGLTGNGTTFSATNMGFDISETLPIAEDIAKISGTGKNLQRKTLDAIALERAYSLDRGQVMDQFGNSRITGKGDTLRDVSTIIDLMKAKNVFKDGDMSRLGEILQIQSKLVQQQGKTLEVVNKGANAQAIAAFQEIGGSFGNDPRAGERIAGIDASLRNPTDTFARARTFATIQRNNPGMSYLQTLKEMEKGMTSKGLLSGTLNDIERQVGGGESGVLATMQRFGIGANQAETLFRGFQKNRGVFDNITESQLKGMGITTANETTKLAEARTAEREKSQADVTNAFVEGATEGIVKIGEKTAQEMVKQMENGGGLIGKAIAKGVKDFFHIDNSTHSN